MSVDDQLAAALAQWRADRLRFEGLPVEGPLDIVRDALERLLLTPEFAKYSEEGIAAGESAAGLLLVMVAPNAPFAGAEVKVLDFAIHLGLSVLKAKAARDQAAEGWTPPRALG